MSEQPVPETRFKVGQASHLSASARRSPDRPSTSKGQARRTALLWPWSGPLRGLLFGLAPDGVFRASSIALGAVGSYPAFSPLPPTYSSSGGIFSVALSVERSFRTFLPRLSHPYKHELRGIAPYGARTFLPGFAPKAILRPSKIAINLPETNGDYKPQSATAKSMSRV